MSTAANVIVPGTQATLPPIELPDSDGEPLETYWHVLQIELLIEFVHNRFRDRDDFFAGGNMFLYYSLEQVRNRDYKGPDFFYVKGVDAHKPRRYWAAWEESNRLPNLIVELLSPTTENIDRTTKKDLYERVLKTPEYYCYDPETEKLEGWRLVGGAYQPIQSNEHGWLFSEQLDLWLGTWRGEHRKRNTVWLRMFDKSGGLVPTSDELREQEKVRADAEHQRAEAEQKRRQELEAENARLRARLEKEDRSARE